VKTLASKSGELAQEIRENRPLASNTIFNDFVTNAVDVSFTASRPGTFGGEATKDRTTKTVLLTDGTNTVAMCHVQDTPMTFWIPPTDWDTMSVKLQHGNDQLAVPALSFAQADPRLVLMPVSKADAAHLNAKVYHTSSDPFKFQDAVLVGAQEGYYGECKFQIDVKTPEYVKLDRSVLKGLFGKFNPSRGDLVFSRTGELLGIMANDTYCLVIRQFNTTSTFQLNKSLREQGRDLTPVDRPDFSMITDGPFDVERTKKGWSNFADVQSHTTDTAQGSLITIDATDSILVGNDHNLTSGDFIFT